MGARTEDGYSVPCVRGLDPFGDLARAKSAHLSDGPNETREQ